MSILVVVCPYAKLPRGDERGNFYHAFKWLVFSVVLFFYFLIFLVLLFCVDYVNVWARQISYYFSS